MTGEDLYNMYVREMEVRGTGLDDWDDLDDMEQFAWDAVAERLTEKLEKKDV